MTAGEILKTDKNLHDFLQAHLMRGRVEELMEEYHQEKMKQHDALVKMMAQDEKEGNYQDSKCKCKIPDLRMKVSENGIIGYCTVCLKQS